MIRFIIIALVLITTSCTENATQPIQELLEVRNTSISQQDIEQYTLLLDPSYLNHDGQQKVEQMAKVFHRFEKVKMESRDQEIRIIDEHQAICEQTYILTVFADGEWRKIVQREQLSFTNTDGQWKISGGL